MELKVLRLVSSTAQSAAGVDEEERDGLSVAMVAAEERFAGLVAMQKGEVLFTQKTSRQQDVTPRFGGRLANFGDVFGREELDELGCDWRRTRTTSRGVTIGPCQFICFLYIVRSNVPSRDVRRLPETAESIFCPADMSVSTSWISGSLASSMVTELPDNVL